MGGNACSTAIPGNARSSKGQGPSKDTSPSKKQHGHIVQEHGARYWHDKMRMSASSQAIFEGAQKGDTRRVLTALNAHGDPNCVNFAGYTALMLAVGGGYREVVALLLQAGGNANYSLGGLTPLMIAAAAGQIEVCRMLINCGAHNHPIDKNGRTALHRASNSGHPEVCHLLLQANSSVDADDTEGHTPLMLAAEEGHHSVIQVLLCAGAQVARVCLDGESALIKSVVGKEEVSLELLLKAGAPVNAPSRGGVGDTALIAAARHGSESMIKRLLQFQAQVNLPNQRRETPLMVAAEAKHDRVVHQLCVAGSDTTLQDLQGYTALIRAAAGGSSAVISICLDFGASPSHASPVDSNTAMTVAAFYGHTEVYNVLIKAGACVGAIDDSLD